MTGVIDDFQKLVVALKSHQCFTPSFLYLRESSYLDLILDTLMYEKGMTDALSEFGYDANEIGKQSSTPLFQVRCLKQENVMGDIVKEKIGQYARKAELMELLESNRDKNSDLEKLKNQIIFLYPHEYLQKLYTKTTVSELKMAAMKAEISHDNREEAADTLFKENNAEVVIPRFAGNEVKVSGTARGSAYHRVMELLDFGQFDLKQDKQSYQIILKKQLDEFETKGRMTKDEIDIVDTRKIGEFLETRLADRMRNAQQENNLHREQPFVLGVSAKRLSSDFPMEETVLIQGIIDVYFLEGNDIILLDYKTDTVKEAKELIERYQTQLIYYTEALERITGLKVKEKLIYSFALKQVIAL